LIAYLRIKGNVNYLPRLNRIIMKAQGEDLVRHTLQLALIEKTSHLPE